jgi:hypothetical protein
MLHDLCGAVQLPAQPLMFSTGQQQVRYNTQLAFLEGV